MSDRSHTDSDFQELVLWATGSKASTKTLRVMTWARRHLGEDLARELAVAAVLGCVAPDEASKPNRRATDEDIRREIWRQIKQVARETRPISIEELSLADYCDDVTTSLASAEQVKIINSILESDLTPGEYVILYCFMRGMSNEDVRIFLGLDINADALKQRLYRIRNKIRTKLSATE
jgi:DNA-directed RNA polymerase specialized sigma24 family protein